MAGAGDEGAGGCSCNTGGTNGGSLLGLALLAMVVIRRKRRSA